MKISRFLIIISFFLLCSFKNASKDPIHLSLQKINKDRYILNIDIKNGFGIQIDAPNKILLGMSPGLKITKADLSVKGVINEKDLQYYKSIYPISININGTGKFQLNAKLYYCNLEKKICIPGRFNLIKNIQ